MTVLASYQNGNCRVELYDDGTKIRSWEGDPAPVLPESIDLKITDYCDAGCAWCHESSTKKGKHAYFRVIRDILSPLLPGTELAIGGGNPLSHPSLENILRLARRNGLIPNVTVNAFHIGSEIDRLKRLQEEGLIFGVGISYDENYRDDILNACNVLDNTIIHVIAGVHNVGVVFGFPTSHKFLVLGYKDFGFGKKYYQLRPVDQLLEKWRYWIGTMMRKYHMSFDNLAIEQLGIEGWVDSRLWKTLYMGGEGQFTMYVNAVTETYGVSSTSEERHPLSDCIGNDFLNVRMANGKETQMVAD